MAIRSGGKDAVALTVFRRLGGNALAVSENLEKVLADAAKSAPSGITIRPVYDQGLLVRTAIANVRDAIIVGGVFSVVILLLFLKSWRATLIASLAIPLSLIISFVFLYLTGDTLNLMSLGGLAVAIGLIIDDTVVVIENIARHLAEGESGDAAVDRASKEISGAVVGSTLTTILVFLPLAFVHGVVGQFFQSLSLALSVALLVSMVVSLTIIPVLAARFLGRRPMPTTGPIYNLMADRYEGLLAAGASISKGGRRPGGSRGDSRLVAVPPPGDGLHARYGRRGICARLRDASGHLAGTDRQGLAAGRRRLAENAGRLRLHPPDRGRAGILRHRSLHRRHPGQPEAPRPARPMAEIFDSLREELEAEVPELETEFVPLILDQIDDLAGVASPIEVKVFGPRLRHDPRAGDQVGRGRGRRAGGGRRESPRLPGQSRHRGPSRQRSDGAGRPDRDGRRDPAQRRPLWSGRQHDSRAGPDDQHPRPLPRPDPVRPRTPGPAADQPRHRDAFRGSVHLHNRGLHRQRRLRPARPARLDPHGPQPQRAAGERTSSRSSP